MSESDKQVAFGDTTGGQRDNPSRPPRDGKQSLALLPICVISSAFLAFTLLPPLYPSAGIFAAPLLVLLAVSACVLVFAPGFALLTLAGENVPASLSPGLVVIGSAAGGWVLFWAWFADPSLGLCSSLALSAAAMLILSFKPIRFSWKRSSLPASVSVIVCIGYLSFAGNLGGLNYGDQLVASRYWAVVDNSIPRNFADCLINHRAGLKPFLVADWHSSDRPPLETGMVLIAYPFVKAAGSRLAYLLLGTAVNIFWIGGLWGFLRAAGITERRILQVVILVALVGAVFINTVYTWPKMLSAALSLTAGAALLVQDCPKRTRALVVGSSGAFSLLAHGSGVFALFGLITLFWIRRKEWGPRDVIVTFALAALVYCPWIAYQKFYDPPGDRLIKWHLAGVVPVDEKRPPLDSIVEEYKKAGLGGFVANKVHNLRMLIGDPTDWNGEYAQGFAQPGWDSTFAGNVRHFFLLRLGPTPMLLLIGIPLLFNRKVRQAAWLKPLAGVLIATLLFFLLLEFGSTPSCTTWLAHTPYTALLLWSVLGALAIGEMGDKWFFAILPFQLILFVVMWNCDVTVWPGYLMPAPNFKPDLAEWTIGVLVILSLSVLLKGADQAGKEADPNGPRTETASSTRLGEKSGNDCPIGAERRDFKNKSS